MDILIKKCSKIVQMLTQKLVYLGKTKLLFSEFLNTHLRNMLSADLQLVFEGNWIRLSSLFEIMCEATEQYY